MEDTQGREAELRYFRNMDGREVDFVLTENTRSVLFVECRWSDDEISPTLRYLHSRFPEVQSWQVHAVGKKDYQTPDHIRVAPAHILLREWK
jgi:predicted AAA+ superfamily ATPase